MSSFRDQGGRGRLAAGLTAAAVMVSTVGVSCMAAAAASARTPAADASGSPAVPGAQLWARTYYPAGDIDAVAASPDGMAVFVTGAIRKNGAAHYATIGYDAGTGAELWVSRFNSGGNYDAPGAIGVSPDSGTVFVVGQNSSSGDYATIAYKAATGRRLWVGRFPGSARALVTSPDGKTVYVTGYSVHYITVAYNAATGARRWLARYQGPGNRNDEARSIAISPAGKTLYVTGRSNGTSNNDYATVAYDAATGARRWASRYNGPANGTDFASGVVVAPGGKSVYVTGGSEGRSSRADFATVAYNAATGAQRWAARYNGQSNGGGEGGSVVITPDGRTVIVAGPSSGNMTGYATLAYNAATGAPEWTRQVLGEPVGVVLSTQTLAVSPDSSTVYVAGPSPCGFCDYHYRTVAFSVATGQQQWMSTYNGPGKGDDNPIAVALSPDGRTLYVTGSTTGAATWGFTTIAYRT